MTAGSDEDGWSAGLQPERTALAWRRLALALMGLALALPRLVWPVMDAWTLAPAGLVGAGAVTLFAVSQHRYLQVGRTQADGGASLRDGRLIAVTVLSSLVLAVVALVVVAARVG